VVLGKKKGRHKVGERKGKGAPFGEKKGTLKKEGIILTGGGECILYSQN